MPRPPASKLHPALPDAPAANWVDRFAPESLAVFFRLARLDRPIGIWLLLWPGWWSLTASAHAASRLVELLILFALGALIMRSAGCIYNDLADRDFDARTARGAGRPLASGAVSAGAAAGVMLVLCLCGAAILFQLNRLSILLGFLCLPLIAVYPFAKRWSDWPQLFLGLAFSWGALLGWSAMSGSLAPAAFCFYAAAIFWTLGYDTIYALQDKEDDALLGLKSSARRLGGRVKPAVALFYGLSWLLLAGAGALMEAGGAYYAGLVFGGGHLAGQIIRLEPERVSSCLSAFRANRDFGAIIFAALLADLAGGWLVAAGAI